MYNGLDPNFCLLLGWIPCLIGGSGGLSDIYDSPGRGADGNQLPEYAHRGKIQPEFVPTHSGNVTAALGKTALLNCRVQNVGNKTVSTTCTYVC